jgi:hypothetical protein
LLFFNFKSNNLKNDINGPWQCTLSGETEKYFIVIEHKASFISWEIQNKRFDGTFKEGIFEAKGRIVDHLYFLKVHYPVMVEELLDPMRNRIGLLIQS